MDYQEISSFVLLVASQINHQYKNAYFVLSLLKVRISILLGHIKLSNKYLTLQRIVVVLQLHAPAIIL